MSIGTKSVLFGAHQFLLHPLILALAWWRLYGFPWDVRLWVAFFVHDLGYLGKPNIDGREGEMHPELGARIMGWLFDPRGGDWQCPHPQCEDGWLHHQFGDPLEAYWCQLCAAEDDRRHRWHDFALYHSRFMARRHDRSFSRLCVADKLATAITPAWLYLPLVRLTGEINEYMDACGHREGSKYSVELLTEAKKCDLKIDAEAAWFRAMTSYLRRWAEEHRDGRNDAWTPYAAMP